MYPVPESRYYTFSRIDKYINSNVFENVTNAFALFKATRANVEQSVKIDTNRGYDTDCKAASASALCGVFSGAKNIPPDGINTLDAGIDNHLYQCAFHQ